MEPGMGSNATGKGGERTWVRCGGSCGRAAEDGLCCVLQRQVEIKCIYDEQLALLPAGDRILEEPPPLSI